jgi:hypothetical protein
VTLFLRVERLGWTRLAGRGTDVGLDHGVGHSVLLMAPVNPCLNPMKG